MCKNRVTASKHLKTPKIDFFLLLYPNLYKNLRFWKKKFFRRAPAHRCFCVRKLETPRNAHKTPP